MASRGTLRKMKPMHPELIPPKGSVPFGMTPDNKQLYKLVRKRGHNEPRLDADGQRAYRKHPTTGEPLVPLNKFVPDTETKIFFLESEGNANVRMVDWKPPSEKEQAAAILKMKIEQMMPKMAEAFVVAGVDPDEVVAMALERAAEKALEQKASKPDVADLTALSEEELIDIAAGAAPAEEPVTEEVEEVEEEPEVAEVPKDYPVYVPVGRFEFSDGTIQRMKKADAIEYEAVVKMNMEAAVEAKANAELTPEV